MAVTQTVDRPHHSNFGYYPLKHVNILTTKCQIPVFLVNPTNCTIHYAGKWIRVNRVTNAQSNYFNRLKFTHKENTTGPSERQLFFLYFGDKNLGNISMLNEALKGTELFSDLTFKV